MPEAKASLLNRLNQHLNLVQPNAIRAFDTEVSAIPDVIKLTLGEPDFDVPDHIKQAAIASIENNDSHYAPSNGTVALREAAADFLAKRYEIQYDPNTEIIVTVGASEGIYSTLTTLLNEGDKVLLPSPNFPLYDPVTLVNGATPVYVDTSDNDFVLSPDALREAIVTHGDALKAVILNFPSNPTGVTYNEEQVKALADVLATTDLIVISDEIYSELTYDAQHVSMAKYLPEQTVVLNGVSKSHAMTGYRIGFIAGPAALVAKIGMIHQFAITTASNPAMAAAVEALASTQGREDTLRMKAAYQARRDFVWEAMTQLGFHIPKPAGAFYIFAKIPTDLPFADDDFAFARDLAHQAALAVIPGSTFGPGGEGYLRLSYAASDEQLREAMARLQQYVIQQRQL
jgi:aminotransferase